ncbi:hypothetical protein DEO72_LG11g1390 [Vigna unguiculata]|uniref:Uncharacterized protein n=1 Tax=Vigna unguiculata TaxID=3917 RepID=A0A4D6NKT4_VIGUN|nr:hypothetical protein DEO72_LG11g1390 [Vigna unguiculata]
MADPPMENNAPIFQNGKRAASRSCFKEEPGESAVGVKHQGINANWGVPRYGVGEELHHQTQEDGTVFDKADLFSSIGIHHGEGCSSNASDISMAKGYDPLLSMTLINMFS